MQNDATLADVVRGSGCTPGTLSDVERGKRKPSGALAAHIQRLSGIMAADWFPAETPAQTEERGE